MENVCKHCGKTDALEESKQPGLKGKYHWKCLIEAIKNYKQHNFLRIPIEDELLIEEGVV